MKNNTGARMRSELGRRFPIPGWAVLLIGSVLMSLLLEIASRKSVGDTFRFIGRNPLAFVLCCAVIAFTLAVAMMFRKKLFTLTLAVLVWAAAGVANYLVLLHRTGQPLSAADLKVNMAAILIAPKYYKWWQLVLLGVLIAGFIAGLVILAVKSPVYRRDIKTAFIRLLASALVLCCSAMICWEGGYVKRTLRPLIYRAYQDYGFAYCFAYSIFDNGMGEPEAYSPVAVSDIGTGIDIEVEPSEETEKKPAGFVEDFKEFVRYNLFSSEPESYTAEAVGTIKQLIKRPDGDNENADVPNYIFVQLESFFDPLTLTDFEIVGDPIPVFRGLMEKYTSGKLYVPTVSGGTANTEFEVLTGCNLDFFGVGEIPFYTVAKNGVIESLATDLKTLGLSTTMLHNYTGSFYDRNIVYSNLCFDRFVSVEYMNGYDVTPNGWAKDEVLSRYIRSSMASTPEKDFIYAVTVQTHGAYPVLEGTQARFEVTMAPGETEKGAMEYYLNQICEVDAFVGELVNWLENWDEPVVLVLFGDHLPGLGFGVEDLADGDLYATPYVIWSNFGLPKADRDIEAYQLGAYALGLSDVSAGVMLRFHQTQMDAPSYMDEMEILEYDIMYGKRYVYGGRELAREDGMLFGVNPILLTGSYSQGGNLFVTGAGFTMDSAIYFDDKAQDTIFVNENMLIAPDTSLPGGALLSVYQVAEDGTLLSRAEDQTLKTPES